MKKPQSLRVEPLEARRVMAVNVLAPLADLTFDPQEATRTIDLAAAFDLAEVTGSVARFTTNQPGADNSFYVELFDAAGAGRTRTTPATVANFLAYVDAGRYRNTFVHRSVPGFVVQAGGFTASTTSPASISAVTQFAAVVNEPGNTNVRGTLAMAKLGGDANSATNQWFFNLADNAANLDNQNGGFTAFGQVLGDGMSVVDAMAAVPRFEFREPFDTIPLRNVAGAEPSGVNPPPDGNNLASSQFVTFSRIDRVGELVFTVTSSDPALVSATLDASDDVVLRFGTNAFGTASITVRATSILDASDTREAVFTVSRAAPAVHPPSAPALTARSDSGASSSDRLTNVTRPTFTGTADKGSVVTVYAQRGSEPPITVGTVKASPKTGGWAFATPRARTFTAGDWTITASARNSAGIVSASSEPLAITIKTATVTPTAFALAAATDTGLSAADGVTNATALSFTGIAEPGSTVSVLLNARSLGSAVADSVSGAFSVATAGLRPGVHKISAIALDGAGNRSGRAVPVTLVIDRAIAVPKGLDLIAASDTGRSNKDNRTSVQTPTFAGSAERNSTVEIYATLLGGEAVLLGTATADRRGIWRFTVPAEKSLAEGAYTITAVASDLAGNRSAISAALAIEIGSAFA